jgi:8-oxo-dGTP pyrophosphatase MutT (NUDIX family)
VNSIVHNINRLTVEEIIVALRKNGNDQLTKTPRKENLLEAAVLVPLLKDRNEWNLLFTRRTDTLQFHKGQVAFPGGAADPEDIDPQTTALRESFEEIALKPEFVNIIGCLPSMNSVTSYRITPVIGIIQWPIELIPSPDEVQKIFTIPLKWLASPDNRQLKPYQRKAGDISQVIFYQPYEEEVVWGITAQITVNLLNVIGLIK